MNVSLVVIRRSRWLAIGALIPELVFRHKVFCARDKREEYGVGRHLEEMVGLCGPFPKSLFEKGDEQLVKEAFDEGGNLKINKLGKVVGLEQRCACVDLKERSKFVRSSRGCWCLIRRNGLERRNC